MLKSIHRLITVSLVLLFVSSPIPAQQRRGPAPKKPVTAEAAQPLPTFDTLLAADSFKVYCEVRAVGGLIRSSAVNDLIDPVMKLGGPPKEFKAMVKWLNTHADILAGSRMLVAGWPSRPKLPTVLVAIEFSSTEEAKKFYPELRDFLPTLLPTPTPTPTPTLAPDPTKPRTFSRNADGTDGIDADKVLVPTTVQESKPVPQELKPVAEAQPTPALPPYQMQQSGSLVLISDVAFDLRNLRPRNSKLLEEDQNFLLARNRFATDSIFLYVDLKSIEKEEKEQRQKWEEEEKKRVETEAANPPKAEEPADDADPEAMDEEQPPPPEPEASPSPEATLETTADPRASGQATLSGSPREPDLVSPIFYSLYGALFGGESKWPEAIAAALVFEGDAYVLRTLVLNDAENRNNAIPFAPQFVFGPAIVSESPNIFPADVDFFVSASLDYPQIYDGMLKAIANAEEQSKKYRTAPVKDGPPPESPFATFEKKLGLKLKDDVVPLLGHELALVLLKKPAKASPSPESNSAVTNPSEEKPATGRETERTAEAPTPNPVIAVSIKDREAVARLIPKIIESFGFKGANLIAQTEKRDGTEITSYAGVFAYAFVGDFLIVSPDPVATRHVVDSYLAHDTLSSNSHFRNFTRWQPRQVLGQVYVAPGLVEQYTAGTAGPLVPVDEKMTEYLSRLSPVIDPLTYALSNDGLGPLHELHVPRNLLQLIIANASREAGKPPLGMNEAMAQTALRSVAGSEAAFKSDNAHYGTLAELLAESLVTKDLLENHGYRIELSVSGDKFEATAVPIEYGKTGTMSYFIDESGVLRAGDHGGEPATISDQPVD